MTDVRIARAYPDLPENLARVALLRETLELAQSLEMVTDDVAGGKEDVAEAQQAAPSTIVELIAQISEQDLKAGLEKELISEEDYNETLIAIRKMELSRNRSLERENERDL